MTVQPLDHERAGERRVVACRSVLLGSRQQPLRREVLDDLIVFDLDVEPLLVPVDQLLQRRRQLPIGGDDGDELADVEAAAQRQIAADRVEEERRHLGQKIVQELDHELALVDAEAQVEELEEAVADLGPLPFVGVVDVDGLDAVDDLADPPGEPAGGELALLSEPQELAAQPRDDDELDADHARRHQAEPEILHHDEDERGRGLRAEKGRQDERVADEAADRLDLVLDDGRGLGGLHVAKRIGREAQNQREQVEAHPAQHALAERALGDVDPVLEDAVDEHEEQEQPRQAEQQRQAIDLEAPEELTWAPPSQSGKPRESWRNGAVSLPWAKDLPWIASLTIRRGRSSEAK